MLCQAVPDLLVTANNYFFYPKEIFSLTIDVM